jgi:hypothetical protein
VGKTGSCLAMTPWQVCTLPLFLLNFPFFVIPSVPIHPQQTFCQNYFETAAYQHRIEICKNLTSWFFTCDFGNVYLNQQYASTIYHVTWSGHMNI